MSTDIHWHDGDTITTRHLPADASGPALDIIHIHPGARHQTTLFMEPAFAKALRDALDTLYPPVDESDDTLAERYADEHAGEFEAQCDLAGMRAGGAQ